VEVVLLGTGNPLPDPRRAGPSTLVRSGESQILIDAGRACTMRLVEAGSLPVLLSGVLITHLHSDHLTDLNDVITTHWVMTPTPSPLRIWGPVGIADFVRRTLAALAPDVGYRLAHHRDLTWEPMVEVVEVGDGDEIRVGEFMVSVHSTDHAPVEPSVGYRLEHHGRVVALAGDTVPCPGLDRLCDRADVYVQTVIRDDLVRLVPNSRFQDIIDYHSTVRQAAVTAQRNGVQILVMTHMVPGVSSNNHHEWSAIAAELFDGEIVIGEDLTTTTI